MNQENASAAPTGTDAGAVPAHEFEVEEVSGKKAKWVLTLHPGHLGLRPRDDIQPYIFLREDFFEKIEFIAGLRVLTLRVPPKVGLKLTQEAAAAFERWFGLPNRAQLAVLLKRRYALSAPIAFLLVLVSLPISASRLSGQPTAFDPINFILGISLLGLWVASRIRPHPRLFLLDGTWFFVVGIGQFWRVCQSHHWWPSIWTVILLWMAYGGFKRWRQFRGGRPPCDTAHPPGSADTVHQ